MSERVESTVLIDELGVKEKTGLKGNNLFKNVEVPAISMKSC